MSPPCKYDKASAKFELAKIHQVQSNKSQLPALQEWDKAVRCFLYEFWDLEDESLQEILPSVPRAIQGWCSNMAQGAKICFVR